MAVLFENNASTTLSATLTNSATGIACADLSTWPSPSSPDYIWVTIQEGSTVEIVKATGRSGNRLTPVTRAQDGTSSPASFSTAARVEMRITEDMLEQFLQVGDTVLTPYTVGDLFYASANDTLSKLAAVSAGRLLMSGGAATAPAWTSTGLVFDETNDFLGIGVGTAAAGLHVFAPSTVASSILEGYAGATSYVGRVAAGTKAAQTATQLSYSLVRLAGRGHDGTSFVTTDRGRIEVLAAELWTSTAQGVHIDFATTPTGSTTIANRWRINSAGNFLASTDNTYDIGASGATRPKDYYGAGKITSASATAGIGYATGAGGTVAQGSGSGKATGVTLNTVTGLITMDGAVLNAGVIVSFTLTNSAIAATDTLILQHQSGGTVGAYTLSAQAGAGSAVINVRNATAGNLTESPVIRFTVIKSVSA